MPLWLIRPQILIPRSIRKSLRNYLRGVQFCEIWVYLDNPLINIGGYAFGNLSARSTPSSASSFVITASQTSGKRRFGANDLVDILDVNLDRFWVDARGHKPPSSETITHAMIYAADSKLNYIFHVHSEEIWQHRQLLSLPETSALVPYGSTEMVTAVRELLANFQSRPLVFATAGHTDGIFAIGHTPRECGGLLTTYLAKARELEIAPARTKLAVILTKFIAAPSSQGISHE